MAVWSACIWDRDGRLLLVRVPELVGVNDTRHFIRRSMQSWTCWSIGPVDDERLRPGQRELQHHDPAARPAYPHHLPQPPLRVAEVPQPEGDADDLEGVAGEGELLGVGFDQGELAAGRGARPVEPTRPIRSPRFTVWPCLILKAERWP